MEITIQDVQEGWTPDSLETEAECFEARDQLQELRKHVTTWPATITRDVMLVRLDGMLADTEQCAEECRAASVDFSLVQF